MRKTHSVLYGGGKKALIERLDDNDFIRDKELEVGLKSLMRTNRSGRAKYAKKIGLKLGMGFAEHL